MQLAEVWRVSSTVESDSASFRRESDPLAEQISACNGIEASEGYLRDSEAIRARQHEQEHMVCRID